MTTLTTYSQRAPVKKGRGHCIIPNVKDCNQQLTVIEFWQCAVHCAIDFTSIISFNPHNDLTEKMLIVPPFNGKVTVCI